METDDDADDYDDDDDDDDGSDDDIDAAAADGFRAGDFCDGVCFVGVCVGDVDCVDVVLDDNFVVFHVCVCVCVCVW